MTLKRWFWWWHCVLVFLSIAGVQGGEDGLGVDATPVEFALEWEQMFDILFSQSVCRTGRCGDIAEDGTLFPELASGHFHKASPLLDRYVQSVEVERSFAYGWTLGNRSSPLFLVSDQLIQKGLPLGFVGHVIQLHQSVGTLKMDIKQNK